jgi:hypothetical protein
LRAEGFVGDHVRVCEVGEAHGFFASVNGVGWVVEWRMCRRDTVDCDLIWFTEVGACCWLGEVEVGLGVINNTCGLLGRKGREI